MGETLTIDDLEETVTFPDLSATVTIPGFNYTTGLESGSFILTGADITLSRAYALGMGAGSYTLTGANADLLLGALLTAEAGNFTLTGADVDLIFGYAFAMDAATFTLTGAVAGLTHEALLGMDAATFTLTGADVALSKGYSVTVEAANFTLTGGDLNFYDPNIVSLLNFDGDLTDEGATGHTWTNNNTITFDAGGAVFSAASSQYADTPDSADWAMGSGDFTVEGIFDRESNTGNVRMFGQIDSVGGSSAQGIRGGFDASNKFFFGIMKNDGSTEALVTSTTTYSGTAEVHFAAVRDGNTLRLYMDGTQEATADVTGWTMNDSAYKFSIGRLGEFSGLYYSGSVRGFRLTKGVCRYPSGTGFTPPSHPFPTL